MEDKNACKQAGSPQDNSALDISAIDEDTRWRAYSAVDIILFITNFVRLLRSTIWVRLGKHKTTSRKIQRIRTAKGPNSKRLRNNSKEKQLVLLRPTEYWETMAMESLVEMHYNYTRLTGLTPSSSFKFCSLIHTNACFMECKLTDNQFEQWKLQAAGQPMSIDLKYKSRHDVANCVLYTAGNYPTEGRDSSQRRDEEIPPNQEVEEISLTETTTPEKVTNESTKRTLAQFQQAPTKKKQQIAKRLKMEEKVAATKNAFPTTAWIVQWTEKNITQGEIGYLLGKSSLAINEQEGTIITSYTSALPKTGAIIANLEKLYDPKSISVVKLHVLSAFLSTLLPAPIVVHLNKQILTRQDKKVAMCVAHSLGIQIKNTHSYDTSTEGGNRKHKTTSGKIQRIRTAKGPNSKRLRNKVEGGVDDLEQLLDANNINCYTFAKATRDHLYGRTRKKNNLFFYGPPSTGKTMAMESLVEMHYNYTRLTGLTPHNQPMDFV
ncbi:unnamed protein product [Leptidea sinapis]|uniref:Parvovirus non-structural protein 1 helicase domain-containing protein n=1 Tax=Leptidea sinapis TaxID=189913 RepID=A0A5E4QST5_9NEOP|nr:unnamed protein product [Leptidea sinapis]